MKKILIPRSPNIIVDPVGSLEEHLKELGYDAMVLSIRTQDPVESIRQHLPCDLIIFSPCIGLFGKNLISSDSFIGGDKFIRQLQAAKLEFDFARLIDEDLPHITVEIQGKFVGHYDLEPEDPLIQKIQKYFKVEEA